MSILGIPIIDSSYVEHGTMIRTIGPNGHPLLIRGTYVRPPWRVRVWRRIMRVLRRRV